MRNLRSAPEPPGAELDETPARRAAHAGEQAAFEAAEPIREGNDMKLESHGRYEYRSILDRPDYSWPGGKRLAVYVALNIEAFRFGRGKGAAIAPPDEADSHSVYS